MSRILVVGSGHFHQGYFQQWFDDSSSERIQAETAYQALQIARQLPPDLVLCDDHLPDMDGLALQECFHTDPLLTHIPFLIQPALAPVETMPGQDLPESDPVISPIAHQEDPQNLAFLYKTAIELAELPPDADVFQLIGQRLQELVSDALIAVSTYDSQSKLFTLHTLVNLPDRQAEIIRALGRGLKNIQFPMIEALILRLNNRTLENVGSDLFALSSGVIPRAICELVERQINLGSLYIMEFSHEATLYGTVTIFMPRGAVLKNRSTIETFINQAAVVLQRRRFEADLRSSERNFRAVIEQLQDGIALIDQEGRIVEWNQANEEITGIKRADVLNQFAWDIQYQMRASGPKSTEAYEQVKKRALQVLAFNTNTLPFRSFDIVISRPDGELRHVQNMLFKVITDEGYFLVSVFRDFTQHRAVELERTRLSRLNGVMADLSTRLLEAASVQEITQITLKAVQDLTGSPIGYVGYIDPETGYLVTPALSNIALETCQMKETPTIFKDFRGLYGWVLIQKKPLLSNNPASDPRASGTPQGHLPIRRFLSVPAMQGDTLVGQIAVANAEQDYTERDIQDLERLALVYALGVQRKRADEALRQNEEKFRTLTEQSSEGMVLLDERGMIIEWNTAMEQITGCPRAAALGRMLWDAQYDMIPPDLRTPQLKEFGREAILSALKTGQSPYMGRPVTNTILRQDGQRRQLEHISFPIQTDIGFRMGSVIRDVTERRWAEERRAMLYQATQEISASVTREQVCFAIHKAAAQVMPVDSMVITLLVEDGTQIEEVFLFDSGRQWPCERRPLGTGLSSYIITSGVSIRCEDLNHEKLVEEMQSIDFGEVYEKPLRAIAVPMRWADRIIGMLSVQSYSPTTYQPEDQELIEMMAAYGAIAFENAEKTASLENEVAEHLRVRAELERLVKTDPLTNLLNRRHFFTLAEAEFQKSIRYNRPLSVIMIDTDHFKKINDQYGHTIGDQALVALAELLQTSVRQVDIVARYGGEEFVILLPETTASGALNLAERIREQVADRVLHIDESALSFTISLGVADNHPDSNCTRFDQILVWADRALYQAKESGRNRCVCAAVSATP